MASGETARARISIKSRIRGTPSKPSAFLGYTLKKAEVLFGIAKSHHF